MRVRLWNLIATSAVAIDHTPPQPGETRVFGENLGPTRSARALSIVHIALFEAVNAVIRGYQSYLGLAPDAGASVDVAIAQATHDALVGTYRSQKPPFARRPSRRGGAGKHTRFLPLCPAFWEATLTVNPNLLGLLSFLSFVGFDDCSSSFASPSAPHRCEVAFSLLFALDKAAFGPRRRVGFERRSVQPMTTVLDSSQAGHRTRPPDVFYRVSMRWECSAA